MMLGLVQLGLGLTLLVANTDDEVCASIRMGDEQSESFEQRLAEGGSQVVSGLLARVVDRLESRQCYERSLELLAALDRRLDELMEADAKLAELRAQIELVSARVEVQRSCPELSCEHSCGSEHLLSFLDTYSELDRATVETWLLAEQDHPEQLSCVLDDALEQRGSAPVAPPDSSADTPVGPAPVLLPDPDTGSFTSNTTSRPRALGNSSWTPKRRRSVLLVSSVGAVFGIAAMIAGGVFLDLDERCPGGLELDACQYRYATREEGIVSMSLGAAALIGSGVGLSFALMRQPGAGPAQAAGWNFGVGWSGRF